VPVAIDSFSASDKTTTEMKILLVQNTTYIPAHGGANKANRSLTEALSKRKHSVRVVAPAAAQSLKDRAEFLNTLLRRGGNLRYSTSEKTVFMLEGVEVHAVANRTRLRNHVTDQINEYEPTWILVSSEDPGQFLLETALSASPSRVVYLAHTMLFFPFGPNSIIRSSVKKELFQRVAGIITVSNYLKEYILRWGERESTVIPFPAYGAGPFPDFGNFDKGAITLINPCAYKGILVFIGLARRMHNVQFAAVPSWGTTEADRIALEQLPNVKLLEATDNIDDIFAQTRILIVPSLWDEGFPLVSIEAMLRGIPVVASNTGGLPESKLGIEYVLNVNPIKHYTEEFDDRRLPVPIIPEQDIVPWMKVLQYLISNRSLYQRLSKASRDAALAYVSNLGAIPFESFLTNLDSSLNPLMGDDK
jgi:glycosyltransferase involved in cell wall biosynthesis